MCASPVRRCARFRQSCAQVRVVLREFYVDDSGVPRVQAAQFLANGTGIASRIEPYLALTISGPPAIPAGIPAGNRRIGSGSKCNAVRHYALLSSRIPERLIAILAFSRRFNTGPPQIVGSNLIGTKKGHNLQGVLPRECENAGY